MPTREEITYILVDDQMPNHDKIAPLTDAAFRLMVESWCLASTLGKDGKIPIRTWNGMGTKQARLDLVEAKLAEVTTAHAIVHDYLDIQRSQAEIAETIAAKSKAGIKGNHRRHHVNKGVRDPECPYCLRGVA